MLMPRIMIAATSSGSGKTTVACGLLQALVNRKLRVASFKCGPDYIDPMFHSKVIGTRSRNLDSFFNDENTLKYLMAKSLKDMDISIIEGVMGYYDGLSVLNTKASSYDIAKITDTPVILLINCKGMSLSILPIIKGFLEYKKDSKIKGVILNCISPMIYNEVKNKIEQELNIKVLGYVKDLKELTLESRHLGLIMPNEIQGFKDKINKIAEELEKTLDIEEIIKIGKKAPKIEYSKIKIPKLKGKVKIAVAYDEAFCFYYEDNMDILKEMGAEIIKFSPLNDNAIPDNVSGLIIGGGYPELFAKELSENKGMIESIREKIEGGMPTIAECGGFMYLHEELEDLKGNSYNQVGIIKGRSYNTNKLGPFGYIILEALEDNFLCKKGTEILGHEFHYFDSTNCGNKFIAKKPQRNRRWECINVVNNLFAGYPHINYYSNIAIPINFLKVCNEYINNNYSTISLGGNYNFGLYKGF